MGEGWGCGSLILVPEFLSLKGFYIFNRTKYSKNNVVFFHYGKTSNYRGRGEGEMSEAFDLAIFFTIIL